LGSAFAWRWPSLSRWPWLLGLGSAYVSLSAWQLLSASESMWPLRSQSVSALTLPSPLA
jgi:hypothetical protein